MPSIRIIGVPAGEAPEEVRRAWLGLTLPLKEGSPNGPRHFRTFGIERYRWKGWLPWLRIRPKGYQVFFVDADRAMEILKEAQPSAAEWFAQTFPEQMSRPKFGLWFEAEVCDFEP